MAGRRVHVFVTEDLISELAHSKAGLDDFIQAVKLGPNWTTRQGLCQKALQCLESWRDRNRTYPPFIAYLALFVLAAGIGGDFAPHAYYPRLRTLLGEEPRAGHYSSFEHMVRLWDDLEHWSAEDRSGELGFFFNSIAGSWFHVGIPIAQTLLTEQERRTLPSVFADAALDPSSPPSDREFARLVRQFARGKLRERTITLLSRREDEEVVGVLVDALLDELREWDGSVGDEPNQSDSRGEIIATLRLCCQFDDIAGTTEFTFRCNTTHDFPHDELLLTSPFGHETLSCKEYGAGWSTRVRKLPTRELINASLCDWASPVVMTDSKKSWHLKLPPGSVRVLVSGESVGLPGLIEVRRLPVTGRFYIAAKTNCREDIKRWGESSCVGFREYAISRGLPNEWSFFRADAVLNDDGIRQKYPVLALPTTTRLLLRGGIRLSRGNQFFIFAPPDIVVESNHHSIEVYCSGKKLDYDGLTGCYHLPAEFRVAGALTIEARHDGSPLKKLSISLDDGDRRSPAKLYTVDPYGLIDKLDDSTSELRGASLKDPSAVPFDFGAALQPLLYGSTYYVGRQPGQVIHYPSEPLPTAWSPVWAIIIHRRGTAEYCGNSLSNADPQRLMATTDRQKLQLWKDLLWHRRKRIKEPNVPSLRRLWIKYREAARRV